MTEENNVKLIDLGEIAGLVLKTLRRFWLPILLTTIVGAIAVMLFFRVTFVPYYESQATLTVNTVDNSLIIGTGGTQVKEKLPYILASQYMKNLVMDDLSLNDFPAEIYLESKQLANFFILTVRAKDPEMADSILNSVLKNCPRASIYVLGRISFEVLDASGIVTDPVNQLNPVRDLVFGGGLGFLMSSVLLVLYLMTRRTVATEEDLKRYLSTGCLASLPQITFKKRRKKIEKYIHIKNTMVGGSFQEMVRTMRSRVKRAADKDGRKVLLVSSSVPEEGKSTVAANLALSLAEKGEKVILVDLDLRKPSVFKILGIASQRDDGMETVLTGENDWHKLLYRQVEWNLDLLGGGLPQTNPIELLNTELFTEILSQLREAYDYVVLDTPPAAMLSDAACIARHADAAIYVVKQDYARIERIAEGIDALGLSRLPILGVVLNGVENVSSRYGGYRSYYGGYGRYGAYGSYDSHNKSAEAAEKSQDFIDLDNPWES